MLFGIV